MTKRWPLLLGAALGGAGIGACGLIAGLGDDPGGTLGGGAGSDATVVGEGGGGGDGPPLPGMDAARSDAPATGDAPSDNTDH